MFAARSSLVVGMASTFSLRIGPDPGARRVGLALNAGGIAIAVWHLVLPTALTGATCIAAPLVAIAVAWFDTRFSLMSGQRDSRADIGGLWFPVLTLTLQAFAKQEMMAPLAPVLAALPLAILLFVVLIKTDLAARSATYMPFTIALCMAWAWGGLVHANVALDSSRPVLWTGMVLETHAARRGRGMTVSVSHAGQTMLLKKQRAGRREVGSPVFVAVRDGRFGWRYFRILDR